MKVMAALPDSVYIFPYASINDQGRKGLLIAWSTDKVTWHDLIDGAALLRCDLNPVKEIYIPYVMQNKKDNILHFFWDLDREGTASAYTSTSDLINWTPQDFFMKTEQPSYDLGDCRKPTNEVLQRGGKQINGWALKVPYALIDNLEKNKDYRTYLGMLRGERAMQDKERFSDLKCIKAQLKIDTKNRFSISENLIGVFFEDLNYAADGGLYAELIQNRDFEYSESDGNKNKDWNNRYAWLVKGEGVTFEVAKELPIHENNPHYAVLDVTQPGGSLVNQGYDGIVVKKGEKYDLSVFTKLISGKRGAKVVASLLDRQGRVLASADFAVSSREWKKRHVTLIPTDDETDATLAIRPLSAGRYAFDMVSLFPQKTFKGRKNGLRADLAQAIADIHPRFLRFPGGCLSHGDGLDNVYHWKETIGPLEARKPAPNIWRYHQTRGLGYFEYFQFCEDIGAEPLPVVAAGVSCQNSSCKSRYSNNIVTSNGQQGGIPMEEMGQYVQDVLDLIEYANGDAKTTKWGRERAKAGHPEPFHLKYIGVGNEDLITRVFKERFILIYNAIKAKYPEITVIGTTGPFCEGADYNEGWKLADQLKLSMVDEHNYNSPGWFIYNQDYYDHYDRTKSKVYLGEYAAHIRGGINNMETALATALFLTGVERNGDVVRMTSYAPLLAKEGYTQWRPDLIYFNNEEVKLTTDYYVQQMFGQNSGNEYWPSNLVLDRKYAENVRKRIGVSVVKDTGDGALIIKLVNMLPVSIKTDVTLPFKSEMRVSALKTVLSAMPDETLVKPVTTDMIVAQEFLYEMPAYSFTVIRIDGY